MRPPQSTVCFEQRSKRNPPFATLDKSLMPLPQDDAAVQSHYRERLAALDREQTAIATRRRRLQLFLGLCVALIFFLGSHHSGYIIPRGLVLVPFAAFLGSSLSILDTKRQSLVSNACKVFHDANLARVDGTKPLSATPAMSSILRPIFMIATSTSSAPTLSSAFSPLSAPASASAASPGFFSIRLLHSRPSNDSAASRSLRR